MIKIRCSICEQVIEITQSEKAKHGLKKFEDHKAACFKELCAGGIEAMNRAASRDR
jgi:hypothetical protein